MNNATITLGIPAYNEQNNIKKLILSLLDQDYSGLSLEKVIISSDGSTDDTVLISKNIPDKRIIVISNKNRKGIARGLNQIIENTKSDILVTLDADIIISDKNFIQKLINPIIMNTADHTSSAILDIGNKTYFSRMLSVSMKLKEILFNSIKDGNNVYNCRGLARGYSSRFYKEIRFPLSIGNDVYSYLFAVQKEYPFKHIKSAIAYYKLPSNLKDHLKQSSRFFSLSLDVSKYFERDFVTKELKIGFKDYLKAFILSLPILIRNPLKSFVYFIIQLLISRKVLNINENNQAWDMVVSSK